jgi:hypothetical protein
MNKILIALQFWEGDKRPAMNLAKLIADLEPRKSEAADFLLVSRFDCVHDMDVVRHVSQKFNVHHYVNRRRGTGWPHGCNELWFGTLDWVFAMSEAKRIPPYKAVLTFEADCAPLSPHWIERLSATWDEAQAKKQAKVVGAFQQYPGPHINGNAMFSGDKGFLRWIAREKGGCSPQGGWDYILSPEFRKRGWADTPLIRSWWQSKTVTKEMFDQLLTEEVALFHGCKDDSLIKHVRRKFLPS